MTHLPPISETLPDQPPMPAFHQVRSLKAGPLTKQGSLFKSWKKRLFVLQESFLLYYVSAADVSPRGALWIRECCVREEPEVSRLQSAKCGSPVYCFSLQCHKSWNIEAKRVFKERTYLLLADSFQDISDWMAILRTMARASADIDLDWEQSYAQTFAEKTMGADLSAQQLAMPYASAASASGSTDSSGVRAHKRNKSKSSSKSLQGHGHGHVRNVSGVAHSSQGSSGGSGSARPRTPLAYASTHSLSSSAAASLLHGRALERERELRDRDRDAATSLSPALNASDGGASTSGAASLSTSGGATPRASVSRSRSRSRSRSLSASRSSLAQHSITQRARPDSDADLHPHQPHHFSAHAQPPPHAYSPLQPNRAAAPAAAMGAASALSAGDWMAAQARDRDAPLSSSSSLFSARDPLQPPSPPRAQRLGETAQRCSTPLAGQTQSDALTPRQHAV